MDRSSFLLCAAGLARGPRHVAAGQHMEVQVLDGLPRLIAAVVDDAVALHAQLLAL